MRKGWEGEMQTGTKQTETETEAGEGNRCTYN